VRYVRKNFQAASSVARSFGADAICIWEPTVFTKSVPSEYEQIIISQDDTLHRAFVTAENEKARLADHQHIDAANGEPPTEVCEISLADVFNGRQWADNTAFVDFCHVSEHANMSIARAMLPSIVKSLRRLSLKEIGMHE